MVVIVLSQKHLHVFSLIYPSFRISKLLKFSELSVSSKCIYVSSSNREYFECNQPKSIFHKGGLHRSCENGAMLKSKFNTNKNSMKEFIQNNRQYQ